MLINGHFDFFPVFVKNNLREKYIKLAKKHINLFILLKTFCEWCR